MPVYKANNNTYYYRIYVLKLGIKKQITCRGFKTKKEANLAMALVENSKKNVVNNLTFSQLYNKYIEYYEQKNKGQSCRRIKSYFENHVLPYFKDSKINKITTNDYLEWKKYIMEKELSDSFNKGLHGSVVTILNYAMKFHGLETNIAKEIGGFKKTYKKKRKEIWTYEEYEKFISVIDDIVDKSLYSTLFETGMRYGELAALTWRDYDGNNLDVNKTISKEFGKDKTYMLTDPKTRSSIRVITLSNNTIKLLYKLKEYFKQYEGFNDNWFIFGGYKPYSHTKAGVHKKEYCKLAKVKCITLHEFRHSHASLLINESVPITDISERLGHADPSITLGIYSHMLRKENDPILDVLNNLNDNYN